jgi:UV excision repair protein RAD23
MTAEQQQKVENLSQMGFEKEACENALRAAFWFEDRAIDYVLNGIPADVMDAMAQAQAQPQAQAPPQQVAQQQGAQPGQEQEGGPLANIPPEILTQIQDLIQNAQFMELRQHARNNPEVVFPHIIGFIQQSKPQLWEFFEGNLELFKQLILGGPEGQQAPAENPNEIRLLPSEAAAIGRLQEFGFEKYECAVAYLSCDKNEEMALSMLFDNQGIHIYF